MADQLCGDFYTRILDLPEVVPVECARQALRTVYDTCFLKFHTGQYGAANGLLPDGTPVDLKGTHPLEVWTGIINLAIIDRAFLGLKSFRGLSL